MHSCDTTNVTAHTHTHTAYSEHQQWQPLRWPRRCIVCTTNPKQFDNDTHPDNEGKVTGKFAKKTKKESIKSTDSSSSFVPDSDEHHTAIFGRVKLSSFNCREREQTWNRRKNGQNQAKTKPKPKKKKKCVAERKRENYSRINTTVWIRHASLATHTPLGREWDGGELVNKTNAEVTTAAHVG